MAMWLLNLETNTRVTPGQPPAIAVDTVNNEIAVANLNDSITVYSRTANCNAAPYQKNLRNKHRSLATPVGSCGHFANNEIVVANDNV